jgi:hypothetical protein
VAVNENAVAGVSTKVSPRLVADTVTRLTGLIAARGMKTFAVIDVDTQRPATSSVPRMQPLTQCRRETSLFDLSRCNARNR